MTTPGLVLPKFARNKSTSSSVSEQLGLTMPVIKRTPAIPIINGVVPTPKLISPKTPLVIPRIGITKNTPSQLLQPDEDPWLPQKVAGTAEVKILAITPIGTISMVPTSDIRPPTPHRILPATPGRHLTLRVIDEHTGGPRVDPILAATVYLDCTKPEDQNYNHVATRMRHITAVTLNLQKQYNTEFKQLPALTGIVSQTLFDEALAVYENNQVFYQDRIDDKTLSIENIRRGLTALEHWFACIIQPKQMDDMEGWKYREQYKLTQGLTLYCDSELHNYIQHLPLELIQLIKTYHAGLF